MKQLSLVSAVRASMNRQASRSLLVAGFSTLAALPAMAEPLMDNDGYEIEIPIETFRDVTYLNSFEFGIGRVSEETVKFGEYNSLEGQGGYLLGSFDILSREPYDSDEWGSYFSARGRHLLTDSSEVQLTIGRQGDYRFDFELARTEKIYSRTYVTPFTPTVDPATGASDPANLELVTGWAGLNGISDPDKAANLALLQSKNLSARRDSYAIGYQKAVTKGWTVTADISREFKEGTKEYGFYTNRVPQVVPEPIEYRTDQVTLSAEHMGKNYQYQLQYYLSQFDNDNQGLTLASAASDAGDPTAVESFALPPSNDFQQFSFNGNYRVSDMTRVTLYTAYSVGTQEEDLLAVDPTLDLVPTYDPAPVKADIERETTIVQLGVSSRVSQDVTVSGKYRYEDKDTDVQDLTYRWGISRGNDKVANTIDFDQKRHRLNLDTAVRLPGRSKFKAGVEVDQIERTNADQTETREKTLKLGYKPPQVGKLMASLDLSISDREGRKTYNPNGSKEAIHLAGAGLRGFSGNEAGSQKYNMADRKRNKYGVTASYPLATTMQLGASAKMTEDEYDKTTYGLQEVDAAHYSVDLSYVPSRTTSATVYYGLQTIDSLQASTRARDGGDWFLDNDETSHLFGTDVKFSVIPNRLDIKVGYRYTKSKAEIAHTVPSALPADQPQALPDIDTKIHTLDISGEYHLDAQSSIKAEYLYERYKSQNFAYDNLGPLGTDATTYLAGGIESPNHSVHFVGLSYKRAF